MFNSATELSLDDTFILLMLTVPFFDTCNLGASNRTLLDIFVHNFSILGIFDCIGWKL